MTQPNEERPDDEDKNPTMRDRKDVAQRLQAELEIANREGRAVSLHPNTFFSWPGSDVGGGLNNLSLPQWLVAVILEWCTMEPQPAMTIEEWTAAMASIEVSSGPYALWHMLGTVDAKADALAHMIHEFGGKK